jgi:hypothetical protein
MLKLCDLRILEEMISKIIQNFNTVDDVCRRLLLYSSNFVDEQKKKDFLSTKLVFDRFLYDQRKDAFGRQKNCFGRLKFIGKNCFSVKSPNKTLLSHIQ